MITSFRTTTLTISRFSSLLGSYDVNGVWSGGTPTLFDIKCSLQPTSQNDLMALPETRRSRKSYTVFTETALQTVKEDTSGTNPDQTTIDGEIYEVVNVEPWKNDVLEHYKVIIQKVN